MQQKLRLLSIDGGGIRGYLPALILAEIERRASRPVIDMFDVLAGTSTGGIIAIGLSAGVGMAELAEFYPRYGAQIFPRSAAADQSDWQKRLFGTGETFAERLMGPAETIGTVFGRDERWGGNARHHPDGLEHVLQTVLGDIRLSESKKPLIVTSYDADLCMPVVFSTYDARADGARFDLPLRSIARATSAAPTYLPPAEFVWDGAPRRFVDGGVWANNPAVVALTESLKVTSSANLTGDSVFLVSLGTGMSAAAPSFDVESSWLSSFTDVAKMGTSVTGADVLAARALGTSYARLQVIDQRIAGAMDNPTSDRLHALRGAAEDLIASESDEIDRIVENLTK